MFIVCTTEPRRMVQRSRHHTPRLRGLRHMVQRLRCVAVRAPAVSIPHGGDELAPPILAAYNVVY